MMRALRIASVFVPSMLAILIAVRANGTDIHVAGHVLAGLWIAMTAVLWLRYRQAQVVARDTVRAEDADLSTLQNWRSTRAALGQLDILSATGRATAWTAFGAIALATITGWASLSVLGIVGLGIVCVATTWTALAAGGDLPWRRSTITRLIVPEVAVEGEPIREEVQLEGVRIPAALRLFATGRATRHGAVSRYSVGSDGNGASIKLHSELGPAPRGEHRVPALTLWLGDVLGLTRTAPVLRGQTRFVATPRPAKVDNVTELLGDGRDDMKCRDTVRMPTEGTFRIREYAPGDDTRRIHWVRSLQAGQLIVRLPDEIPPADPVVRLVLDNHLAHTHRFTSHAPDQLLDVMVRVWLGIGKKLAESGTRVTLVTATEKGGAYARTERPLLPRASHESARFAARVAWQPSVRLDMLIDRTVTRQIVVSCRPRAAGTRTDEPSVAWVIVAHNDWTSPEAWPITPSAARLPFPAGSAENRYLRRRAEHRRLLESWKSRRLFSDLCWIDWKAFSGGYVARPTADGASVTLQEIP